MAGQDGAQFAIVGAELGEIASVLKVMKARSPFGIGHGGHQRRDLDMCAWAGVRVAVSTETWREDGWTERK